MKSWCVGLLVMIGIAPMSEAQLSCPGDINGDGVTTVDEIVASVNAALNGCAEPQPTPTCPPPSAGRTCTPYEIYSCATDNHGCPVCECCNFEGFPGCCQLSNGCFDLANGGGAAECVANRHGSVFAGCPLRCEAP